MTTETRLRETLQLFLRQKFAPNLIIAAYEDWAKAQFANDPVGLKCALFLTTYDPLFILSPQEIGARVQCGIVSQREALNNQYANETLQNIVNRYGESAFLSLSYQELRDEMDKSLALRLKNHPLGLPKAPRISSAA